MRFPKWSFALMDGFIQAAASFPPKTVLTRRARRYTGYRWRLSRFRIGHFQPSSAPPEIIMKQNHALHSLVSPCCHAAVRRTNLHRISWSSFASCAPRLRGSALEYLEKMKKQGGAAELQAFLSLETARTQIDLSHNKSADERLSLFRAARKDLDAYIKTCPARSCPRQAGTGPPHCAFRAKRSSAWPWAKRKPRTSRTRLWCRETFVERAVNSKPPPIC